jgi:hypothetical protein
MRRKYFILLGAGSAAFIGLSAIGVRAACSEDAPDECGDTEGMQSPDDSDDTDGGSAQPDGSGEVEESGEPDDSDDDSGSNDSDDDSSGI